MFAADLVRISYNSYLKNYCSLAANKLGGDFTKLSTTVLQAASSALGLGGEDPFAKLKKEVMYDILVENTISSALIRKVMNCL